MRVHTGARLRLVFAAVTAVALVATAGCGGGKGKVKGKVTHGGKTVVWGGVTLVDATGMYHQGDIDLQGNYEIDGVPIGGVKIAVHSPTPDDPRRAAAKNDNASKTGSADSEDPREKFMASQGGKKAQVERPKPPPGAWFALPEKFTDAEKSGMTATIKSGSQTIDIDLK